MSALGLGCRSLSSSYERGVDEKRALDVLNFAVDNGVTFFDTSDFYGAMCSNEKLLGVVCCQTHAFLFFFRFWKYWNHDVVNFSP